MNLFYALREKIREGYSSSDFIADLMAGLVVGLVALPLGMALAVASGVLPQYGLYTVIIAGFSVALFGGSRLQVTGPTAAFVVILVPIVHKYGLSGLLVSGMMAGVILMALGFSKMGRLIEFIPHPVTTGFTSGIAVVIGTIQIKDFLGLKWTTQPETFIERLEAIATSLPTFSTNEVSVGLLTLSLLIVLQTPWVSKISRGWNRKIPAPLTALSIATLAAIYLNRYFPGFHVDTIATRFSDGIPQALPQLVIPWNLPGAGGEITTWNLKSLENLVLPAFTIAILGAIESLLSAVVADGYAKTRHEPNTELIALGIGNIITPFFCGIPATGAIARTATNFRFGAKSPIAAMIHAAGVLIIVLLFAPYVSKIPMASLAALLILVAFNMAEVKGFRHILQVAPRSDVMVLVTCFFLTVIFDMVVGVTAGIILASVLFIRRMSSFTSIEFIGHAHENNPEIAKRLPKNVVLYSIDGPLFFGAAQRAVSTLDGIHGNIRAVIFDLTSVPILDISGLIALENCILALERKNKTSILLDVGEQPTSLIKKSDFFAKNKKIYFAKDLDDALNFWAKKEASQ